MPTLKTFGPADMNSTSNRYVLFSVIFPFLTWLNVYGVCLKLSPVKKKNITESASYNLHDLIIVFQSGRVA